MTSIHDRMTSLRAQGLTQVEIAAIVGRHESSVSKHLNNVCVCDGPKFIYVPSSWFRCRLKGCGWFDRNGCRHEWTLDI